MVAVLIRCYARDSDVFQSLASVVVRKTAAAWSSDLERRGASRGLGRACRWCRSRCGGAHTVGLIRLALNPIGAIGVAIIERFRGVGGLITGIGDKL